MKTREGVIHDEDNQEPMIVSSVTCPIINDGRSCSGQFHVNVANIPTNTATNNNNDVVIDLCDDDNEGEEPMNATAAAAAGTVMVKSENVVKRRRLDPSLEAKLHSSDFWSVNPGHIQFSEQAFVNKAIFHLNSFIYGKKRINEGFSEFIREGVAAPGVEHLPATLDIDKIADWNVSELTDTLTTLNNSDWDASKTAKWLKNATVGSFIIMRHEYPKCPFCPKRLIVDGKYIGPVYVIGIITKKVIPWSEEERDIAEDKLGGFSGSRWPISTVCRVSWRRMGYKKTLEKTTRDYMNHVCQPSFQQICDDPEKVFAGGATSESVRRDLWSNAIIPISSNEFPDKFIHEGVPVWEEEE